MQSRYEQSLQQAVSPLAALSGDWSEHLYREVEVQGEYDNAHQFLLDNQMQGQQAGYAVITPLILADGRTVLVNRGWLPRSASREQLPVVEVAEQVRMIRGRINLPGKAFGLGEMSYEQGWPLRLQYLDYPAIGQRLERQVEPFVLMLGTGQADGYVRNWQPVVDGPGKNYSYMGQWLAMATAVLFLYIVLNVKRRESHE